MYQRFAECLKEVPKTIKLLEDPSVKYQIKLIEKVIISHDTRRFRFALPTKQHVLGLPTGSYIYMTASIGDETCTRPYTPVSSDDDHGYVDFVIKVYFKNVNPQFPNGGKMTQHLDSLAIGDAIEIRGPLGNFVYHGKGLCAIREDRQSPFEPFTVRRIGMIAGGSGITPILQVIRHALKGDDKTELWLLFANRTEDDILLRDELDQIAKRYGSRVHVWYTLSQSRSGDKWKYSVGHVDADMFKKHLPPAGDDTLILACGPKGMIKSACEPNLDALGYSEERRFVF